MDADQAPFAAWRMRDRRREWVVRLAIVGAFLLCMGAGLSMLHRGRRAMRETGNLATALREAAGRIAPVAVPSEDQWNTSAYSEARSRNLYREALAAGVPVLCLGPCSEITLRVALDLDGAAREAWLVAAMDAATEPGGHSLVMAQVERAVGEKHVGAYLRTGAEVIWEAVYNLSGDRTLRADARSRWEASAVKGWIQSQHTRSPPGYIRVDYGVPPKPEFPDWKDGKTNVGGLWVHKPEVRVLLDRWLARGGR